MATTTNNLIREARKVASAYVPPRKLGEWTRGWRRTARLVVPATLKAKLDKHIARMRMAADEAWIKAASVPVDD